MASIGNTFASTGLSADFWTGLGLVVSVGAGIAYSSPSWSGISGFSLYQASLLGGILLLISGFFDIVDGSVARVTKQSSKKGAFLDSTFDKIAETVIFVGIAFGGLANPLLCMIALALSLLVSYTRSRAESLGVELKGVGIGERAERLLILAIIGMIPFSIETDWGIIIAMEWAVIIVSIVAGITLIQRIVASVRKLS